MDEHAVLRHQDAPLSDLGQRPHPVDALDGVAAAVGRNAGGPQVCGAFGTAGSTHPG